MARDYRHGHGHRRSFQRKSQQEERVIESRSPLLVWGGALLISVIFIAVFFVVKHFVFQEKKPSESVENVADQLTGNIEKTPISEAKMASVIPAENSSEALSDQRSEPVPSNEKEVREKEMGIDYSFYQGLSQTEVIVEAELISVALEQPYYIQAGSFGSKSVAMQEVNRLKKHGQQLEISALKKGDRTYYRLRVGPFSDRLLMNKKRNELRKLGVDTLLIKVSK
ncbi:MAG TPA: SPOR domain-containing protein [Thiomicrorhabdus sp.]|nr:SPOR domain-containing protein [Thiomicrorhabdus sp.]